MYKEAGVFGPISISIQVTEFTVSIKLFGLLCFTQIASSISLHIFSW